MGMSSFCSTISVVYANLAGKILKTFFTAPIRSHFVTLFCFLLSSYFQLYVPRSEMKKVKEMVELVHMQQLNSMPRSGRSNPAIRSESEILAEAVSGVMTNAPPPPPDQLSSSWRISRLFPMFR